MKRRRRSTPAARRSSLAAKHQRRKPSPDGPNAEPGDWLDREVTSYDGRTMVLRWADPKVRDTYGTMLYVRCPPEGAKPKATPTPKSKSKPKPG